jgi:hypothetical protein
MSQDDLAERLEQRFAACAEAAALFRCQAKFEQKFRTILKRQYEQTVVCLGMSPPAVPSWVRKQLPAGISWLKQPPGLPKLEACLGRTQWQRLTKRHAQKREKALLCVANDGFRADLFSLAEDWGLSTEYFLVAPTSFYPGAPMDGRYVWETLLLWMTAEHLIESGAEHRTKERAAALQYVEDLDFSALRERRRLLLSTLPIHRFRSDVRRFARENGLSALWEPSVEALLLCGWFFVPFEDCRAVIRLEGDQSRLSLEIFPETREAALVAKWRRIKGIWAELFPGQSQRQRSREHLARDLKAMAARSAGHSMEDIVDGWNLPDWQDADRAVDACRHAVKRLPTAQAGVLRAAAEPHVPRQVVAQMLNDDWAREEWYF